MNVSPLETPTTREIKNGCQRNSNVLNNAIKMFHDMQDKEMLFETNNS